MVERRELTLMRMEGCVGSNDYDSAKQMFPLDGKIRSKTTTRLATDSSAAPSSTAAGSWQRNLRCVSCALQRGWGDELGAIAVWWGWVCM